LTFQKPAKVWLHGSGDDAWLELLEHPSGETADTNDMIWKFTELRAATPQAVLDFARRYGPIGFCGHGRPATHDLDLCQVQRVDAIEMLDGRGGLDPEDLRDRFDDQLVAYREPIQA
jgi:hypothetical protein